jgi:hypothetical protein
MYFYLTLVVLVNLTILSDHPGQCFYTQESLAIRKLLELNTIQKSKIQNNGRYSPSADLEFGARIDNAGYSNTIFRHQIKPKKLNRISATKFKTNDIIFEPSKPIPIKPSLQQRSGAAISYAQRLIARNDLPVQGTMPSLPMVSSVSASDPDDDSANGDDTGFKVTIEIAGDYTIDPDTTTTVDYKTRQGKQNGTTNDIPKYNWKIINSNDEDEDEDEPVKTVYKYYEESREYYDDDPESGNGDKYLYKDQDRPAYYDDNDFRLYSRPNYNPNPDDYNHNHIRDGSHHNYSPRPTYSTPTEYDRPTYPTYSTPTEYHKPTYPTYSTPTEYTRPSYPSYSTPTEYHRPQDYNYLARQPTYKPAQVANLDHIDEHEDYFNYDLSSTVDPTPYADDNTPYPPSFFESFFNGDHKFEFGAKFNTPDFNDSKFDPPDFPDKFKVPDQFSQGVLFQGGGLINKGKKTKVSSTTQATKIQDEDPKDKYLTSITTDATKTVLDKDPYDTYLSTTTTEMPLPTYSVPPPPDPPALPPMPSLKLLRKIQLYNMLPKKNKKPLRKRKKRRRIKKKSTPEKASHSIKRSLTLEYYVLDIVNRAAFWTSLLGAIAVVYVL